MTLKINWLNDLAQLYYERLAPRVSDQQYDLLEIVCVNLARFREAQREIDQGLLIETLSGHKANPAIKIQQDAFSALIRAWKEINWQDEDIAKDELEEIIG